MNDKASNSKNAVGIALILVAIAAIGAFTLFGRTGEPTPPVASTEPATVADTTAGAQQETPPAAAQEAAPAPQTQVDPTALKLNLLEKEAPPPITMMSPTVEYGDQNAPVTVEEFASMSCPHCAEFANTIFPVIEEKFIKTGKIRFVFNFWPHNAPALKGTMLVMCAPPERRATFIKVLYSMQKKWAFNINFEDELVTIGNVGGLSPERARACLKDTDLERAILLRQKELATRGINTVPYIIINGTAFEKEKTVEGLTQAIEGALASPSPAKEESSPTQPAVNPPAGSPASPPAEQPANP